MKVIALNQSISVVVRFPLFLFVFCTPLLSLADEGPMDPSTDPRCIDDTTIGALQQGSPPQSPRNPIDPDGYPFPEDAVVHYDHGSGGITVSFTKVLTFVNDPFDPLVRTSLLTNETSIRDPGCELKLAYVTHESNYLLEVDEEGNCSFGDHKGSTEEQVEISHEAEVELIQRLSNGKYLFNVIQDDASYRKTERVIDYSCLSQVMSFTVSDQEESSSIGDSAQPLIESVFHEHSVFSPTGGLCRGGSPSAHTWREDATTIHATPSDNEADHETDDEAHLDIEVNRTNSPGGSGEDISESGSVASVQADNPEAYKLWQQLMKTHGGELLDYCQVTRVFQSEGVIVHGGNDSNPYGGLGLESGDFDSARRQAEGASQIDGGPEPTENEAAEAGDESGETFSAENPDAQDEREADREQAIEYDSFDGAGYENLADGIESSDERSDAQWEVDSYWYGGDYS